jgi:hypothetical protein
VTTQLQPEQVLPVAQLAPLAFPSHKASAPQEAEQMVPQLLPEQLNGPQLAKFIHCQNLLQYPEPSHLYCCCPVAHVPLHSVAPVKHALLTEQLPPEHAVS